MLVLSVRPAAHENSTIYQEEVPAAAALPAVEAKLVVKPVAPPPLQPSETDPFVGVLLPESVRQALERHHTAVHTLLHALATQATGHRSDARARLTNPAPSSLTNLPRALRTRGPTQVSTDAQRAQEELRKKDLPHVLEAVTLVLAEVVRHCCCSLAAAATSV